MEINPTEVEKQMLDNLGVDVSMRLANPAPIMRIPREKKRKLNEDGNGKVIRCSKRNQKKN